MRKYVKIRYQGVYETLLGETLDKHRLQPLFVT